MLSTFSLCLNADGGGHSEKRTEETSMDTGAEVRDRTFAFTTQIKYMVTTSKSKIISPRYCDENIKYLKILKLKKIA